jgi:Fis family transcriptional regulator
MSTARKTGGRAPDEPLDVAAHLEGAPLRRCVTASLESYFQTLDGHGCVDLLRMVLAEVEPPLLESVMRQAQGNQSKAAAMLGINRGTLRKKLRQYDIE